MFKKLLQRRSEEGQGLVEYALILVLVSITVIVVLTLLGNNVAGVFSQVDSVLSGQSISGTGTEYVVGGFSVTASGGPAVCTVKTSTVTVTKYNDGSPVGAGESVSVSFSVTGGGTASGSGTTNASGQAVISAQSMSGNCSGSVTASAGSNSRSSSY